MNLLPDQTVIFQWLLFMTAFIALHYGVFRPVLHLLHERRKRTEGEKEEAEALFRHAEILLAECKKKMEAARIEGLREREARLLEAEKIQEAILKKAKGEVDEEIEKMRRSLEREARQASLELHQYAQKMGHEIAEKVLEREI